MRTKKNGTNTKKMCAKLAWTDKKNRNRKIMKQNCLFSLRVNTVTYQYKKNTVTYPNKGGATFLNKSEQIEKI